MSDHVNAPDLLFCNVNDVERINGQLTLARSEKNGRKLFAYALQP